MNVPATQNKPLLKFVIRSHNHIINDGENVLKTQTLIKLQPPHDLKKEMFFLHLLQNYVATS